MYTHTHTHTPLPLGLANRVVPKGQALDEALKLANQIAEFPQACLNADRNSAYYSVYSSHTFIKSLMYEHHRGKAVLDEAIEGAKRFREGEGRGGKFE